MADLSISSIAARAAMPIQPSAEVGIPPLGTGGNGAATPPETSSVVTISPEGARLAARVQVPPGGT